MITVNRFVLVVSVVGMTACASSGSTSSGGSVPSGPARWTGSFKQTQMATSAVLGPATPNRGFGSITLTPDADGKKMRVELSINAPVATGSQIAWAIYNGVCGSPAPMVTGEMQFPPIEVTGSGNGSVRANMSFELDSHSAYHANVYWSSRASDLNDVMMCAPLVFGAR